MFFCFAKNVKTSVRCVLVRSVLHLWYRFKYIVRMKKYSLEILVEMLLFFIAMPISAQKTGKIVSDEELRGVWVYTSYRVGDKMFDNDFHSIKIYGENGEYCCARAQKLRCGTYRILPVDYGTYVFRNGEYTECGRKGNLNLVSSTEFNGMYIGRLECWEKIVDFPEELKLYIVNDFCIYYNICR